MESVKASWDAFADVWGRAYVRRRIPPSCRRFDGRGWSDEDLQACISGCRGRGGSRRSRRGLWWGRWRRKRRRRDRPGHHLQLGHRASLARPGPRDGHDLGGRHHNIMDPLVKLGDGPRARAEPRRVLGRLGRREDRDVPPPRGRQVDERRPGHRRGLRVVVEADALARPRGRLRVPVLRHRGRGRVQRVQVELRAAARQDGRPRGRRAHARGELTSPQPWFIQQAAHHSFVAVHRPDRRAVRRQVDGGREHRHERAVPASTAGSTTPGSTSSSGTSGGTPTTSRSSGSTGG